MSIPTDEPEAPTPEPAMLPAQREEHPFLEDAASGDALRLSNDDFLAMLDQPLFLGSVGLDDGEFWETQSCDFTDLHVAAPTPETGEIAFLISQADLAEALLLTRFGLGKKGIRANVKLSLLPPSGGGEGMKARLRFEAADDTVLVVTDVTISSPSRPATGSGRPVSFLVDHGLLVSLTKLAISDVAFSVLFAKQQLLVEIQGRTRPIPIAATPPSWEVTLAGDLTEGREIDPRSLHDTLGYLSVFAVKDDVMSDFSHVEINGGYGKAGSIDRIALVEAPALNGLELRIANDHVDQLRAIVSQSKPQSTRLINAEGYWALRDDKFLMAARKTEAKFPPLGKITESAAPNSVLVSRIELINCLRSLGLSQPEDVRLGISGGRDASLELMIISGDGETWQDTLTGRRATGRSNDPWQRWVELAPLLGALGQFDSANVELQLFDRALRIHDEDVAKGYFATAIFGTKAVDEVLTAGRRSVATDALSAPK